MPPYYIILLSYTVVQKPHQKCEMGCQETTTASSIERRRTEGAQGPC